MTNLAHTIPADAITLGKGEPVFPQLRKRLRHYPEILKLVDEREAYGIAKYGQTLMTGDERDTPTEICNEMLDLLAYMTKYCMTHDDDWMDHLLLRYIAVSSELVRHFEDIAGDADI